MSDLWGALVLITSVWMSDTSKSVFIGVFNISVNQSGKEQAL